MLREVRPGERTTRIRSFSWLLVGLYESRSVHLSKVADRIPGKACLPSVARRMRRLLDNRAIRVRECYELIAKGKIQRLADGETRLIVDGSKIGFGQSAAAGGDCLPQPGDSIGLDLGKEQSWTQYST